MFEVSNMFFSLKIDREHFSMAEYTVSPHWSPFRFFSNFCHYTKCCSKYTCVFRFLCKLSVGRILAGKVSDQTIEKYFLPSSLTFMIVCLGALSIFFVLKARVINIAYQSWKKSYMLSVYISHPGTVLLV